MNDEVERAAGRSNARTSPRCSVTPREAAEMREPVLRAIRVTRQHDELRPELQLVVRVGKRLDEPRPEKAGATGEEDPSRTRFRPQLARVREHVVEVFWGKRRKRREGSWLARDERVRGQHVPVPAESAFGANDKISRQQRQAAIRRTVRQREVVGSPVAAHEHIGRIRFGHGGNDGTAPVKRSPVRRSIQQADREPVRRIRQHDQKSNRRARCSRAHPTSGAPGS